MVWFHATFPFVTPICNKIGLSFYYGHPPVKASFWVPRVASIEGVYYLGLKCRNVLNVFVLFSYKTYFVSGKILGVQWKLYGDVGYFSG